MQASISPSTYARYLSTDDLRKLIYKSLSDGVTGRIHITFRAEKTLTIFAHQGIVRQVYIRNHRVPDMDWEIPLAQYGRGDLEIELLPSRGLMFRKVLLEELGSNKLQPSSTSQLKVMFDLAEQNNANPTLFHILWNSAEAFVLVAGRDISLRHAVMVTRDGAKEGSVALDQVTAWSEAACNVTIHRGNIQSQAWFETYLNILFEHFCSRILNQYGQLTGKVMIRSIVWKIHTMSVEANWKVEMQENVVRDATIFSTARDAGDAYKKIISEIIAHIDPLIGYALTHNILTESSNSTKGVYKTIAEVFGLLGEEFL
jgi:hypothetical protein